MRSSFRLLTAALLGVGVAVLVSCGSSGKGLIPARYAGPLQNDFQAVLQAAQEGDGSCTATEAAVRKTEHDLQALPSSVDDGLRGRLAEGVANLSVRAHQLCTQPLGQTTTTTTAPTKTSPPATSTAKTQTAPTGTQAPTPTTGTAPTGTTPSPPAGEEGGTQAPGAGNEESQPGEAEAGGGQAGSGAAGQGGAGENGLGAGTGGTGGGQ
jgi:hypothetical protein